MMKRITYAGGSIVTGNAVTAALLDYATAVVSSAKSVSIEIPVLEENGTTALHTLLLGPSSQFGVADIDGAADDESDRFPVPELPIIGQVALTDSPAGADSDAAAFDRAVASLDAGMNEEDY